MTRWESDGAVWALSLDGTVLSTLWAQSYTGVGQGSQKGIPLVMGQREHGRLNSVVTWPPGVCRSPCRHKSLLLSGQVVLRGVSSCVDLLQAATDEEVSSYGMKCCHFILLVFDASKHRSVAPGGPLPPSLLNIYLFRVINPFSLSILLECFCRIP